MRSAPVGARARQEPLEHEPVGREAPTARAPISTALGPGTTSTASPASRHARTRRSPGIGDARHAGVGHVRDALARRATASTTQSALSCSLCACTARSRPAAGNADVT